MPAARGVTTLIVNGPAGGRAQYLPKKERPISFVLIHEHPGRAAP